MYIVGGELSGDGIQITNEVLQLDLSQDAATPQTITTTSPLPPTAFHSLTYANATDELVVYGGLTSSCSSDSMLHSLVIGDDETTNSWRSESPTGMVRRRGAEMVLLSAATAEEEKLVIFGGLADHYVCSSSSYYYPAFDVLTLPLSSTPNFTTDSMTASTSSIGVEGFSHAQLANNTVLFAGGVDSSGALVPMDKLNAWSNERDWYELPLTGHVPASRVGATLVAHPIMQEILILHGGVVTANNVTSPITTVSLLNLTSLSWSTPSYIQPPATEARAWHTNVVTPSGVMITAFGLGSGGYARSDIAYLDMRDSTPTNWGWKKTWTNEMLDSTVSSGTNGTTSSINITAATSNNNAAEDETNLLKKVLPPSLIVGVILLALLVWLGRRQVKAVRRRRMAQHFEIENTHDEEGNRRGSIWTAGTLNRFVNSGRWRRSSSFAAVDANGLSKPFGGVRIPDTDEDDESVKSQSKISNIVGILKRWSGAPQARPENSREMTQKAGHGAARVQWEEIDFGLGKVEQQRRSSVGPSRPNTPGRRPTPEDVTPRQITAGEFNKNRSRVSFPDSPETGMLDVPNLVVVPPSNPCTPGFDGENADPLSTFTVLMPSAPIRPPVPSLDAGTQEEWDALERDVQATGPFKRSSTISSTTIRSQDSIEPALPRMSFEKKPDEFSSSLKSYGTGLGQPLGRQLTETRTDELSAGRSVSNPVTPPRHQPLAHSMGYSPGYVRDLISGHAQSPARIPREREIARSRTIEQRPAERPATMFEHTFDLGESPTLDDAYMRSQGYSNPQRLSNPPKFPPPTSPLPNAPKNLNPKRRSSAGGVLTTSQQDSTGTVMQVNEARELRIANASPDIRNVDEFGSQETHRRI